MAAQLMAFYAKAKEEKGVTGGVKLAMLTKMGPAKAVDAPDSPENIKLFKEALAKL